jgi:hypothetical protein
VTPETSSSVSSKDLSGNEKDNLFVASSKLSASFLNRKQNKNHKYLLTYIDVYSRYSFCVAVKTKKGHIIFKMIKTFLKKMEYQMLMVQNFNINLFINILKIII